MKERAAEQVSPEFLAQSEEIRVRKLEIAREQARARLYADEKFLRRGREFAEASAEMFQRFVDTVVEVMFPEGEKLSDEQIVERGFRVDTVRGKARATRGFMSRIYNDQTDPRGSSGFMQRTGINRNREGIK